MIIASLGSRYRLQPGHCIKGGSIAGCVASVIAICQSIYALGVLSVFAATRPRTH